MSLPTPTISHLSQDPPRTHRINANSFQQNALLTSNGYQYTVFYTSCDDLKDGACFVNIGRRKVGKVLGENEWEIARLEDYRQIVDDGHNTISLGVSEGDGRVHLAFDHHCDVLNFRISKPGVTTDPSNHKWDWSLFSETIHGLPGLEPNELMKEITYPRFLSVGQDLILGYRIGQAGSGSDLLYHYSSQTQKYTYLGQPLTGISNSPYINGISLSLVSNKPKLHLSWCYRNVISIPASVDGNANTHKQQAGPNGPENNFDLHYASSDNLGVTWKNSEGVVVARLDGVIQRAQCETVAAERKGDGDVSTTILPSTITRVFEIPMGSGILNQEGQCADAFGGFWVLNREKMQGEERWIVYHRALEGAWARILIESISQPTETGSRGSICADRKGNTYLLLPGNSDTSLEIMRAERGVGDRDGSFVSVWRGEGYDGEPLVDEQMLAEHDILSVFTRTSGDEKGERSVVLDFNIG